ncbi:glycogen-binding domain-containing protein [Rhodohalobacter sp. SW132]|nr:glycogen-binding domain-containing protein [Rhodohalobacter sp. SW132]
MISFLCTGTLFSQTPGTSITVESQAGYSTNTFLHPMINEWDISDSGAFTRLIPSAQIFWATGRFSADLSGGYVLENIYDERNNWNGGFGSAQFRYRLSETVSAGAGASGSRLQSEFGKQTLSFMPEIEWSPSLFTRVRARAGSSFRTYELLDDTGEIETTDRFDFYGVEMEHWPSFRWQLRGGVYGLADKNLFENHSISASLSRVIGQSAGIALSVSANRYTNRFTITPDGGGPQFGPTRPEEEESFDQIDRLLRGSLNFTFPVAGNFSGRGSAGLNLFLPGGGESRSDVEASVGLRYTFSASSMFRNSGNNVSPEWDQLRNSAVMVSIEYRGDGDLYITGEFNDWEQPGVPLSKVSGRKYAAELNLNPGIYEYKVLLIANGEETWVEFTDETMTVSDGFGGTNGLIFLD